MSKDSIVISGVLPESPAWKAGLRPGDHLRSINRHRVRDSIDLLFYSDEPTLNLSIIRDNKPLQVELIRDEGEPLGIEIEPFRVKRCRNRCIFCFVNQLPKGLRKTLYIKDEDYRLSFLYGNYITLSNITEADRRRIVTQRLSPLYISVHTTNSELRQRMLRARKPVDIMKELTWLTQNRIRFHAQIVLCPGYNDGDELRNTLNDLQRFYPYIMSIAVVPVGLTKYHSEEITPVGKEDARDALQIIQEFEKKFRKKYGDPLVYAADELYIKAERRFPPLRHYGDLHQIENGVGMVPLFLEEIKGVHPPERPANKRFITVTGESFYPFLKKALKPYIERLNLLVVPVKNRFFGESVTVTGLLTGRDIIYAVSEVRQDGDILLLPDVMLREYDEIFLDDVRVKEVSEILGIDVDVIESSPAGLMEAISGKRSKKDGDHR